MRRDGYITIFALLFMFFTFSSLSYLLYYSKLQFAMVSYKEDSSQGKYLAEDVFNNIFYDKEIFSDLFDKAILRDCRNYFSFEGAGNFNLNSYVELNQYFKNGKYRFLNLDGSRVLSLKLELEYKKSQQGVHALINTINPLLELGEGLILPFKLDNNNRDIFDKNMMDLNQESFKYQSYPTNSIYIHNLTENVQIVNLTNSETKDLYQVIGEDKTWLRNFRNHCLVLSMINPNKKIDLIVGEERGTSKIRVNGALYLEGDLIINQPFEFNGTMVINGGRIIVNSKEAAVINGILFYNNEEEDLDESKIIINYNKDNIGKYGSYLPIYIYPRINRVKILL